MLDSLANTDRSAEAAEAEELAAGRPSSRGDDERGDADRERGKTSTTFNLEEEELDVVALTWEIAEDISRFTNEPASEILIIGPRRYYISMSTPAINLPPYILHTVSIFF